MFTKQDLSSLISQDFNVLFEEVGRDPGNYENVEELIELTKKIKKATVRVPLKFGLIGGINYTLICKKK